MHVWRGERLAHEHSCESVGVYMPMCVREVKRQLWSSVFIFQLVLEGFIDAH